MINNIYEDKMKDRDNEFLYDKCVKQYHYIINCQAKIRDYKKLIEELTKKSCKNISSKDCYILENKPFADKGHMNAKEMFEKLGYSWKEEISCIEYTKVYWEHWLFKSKKVICFWRPLQKVEIYNLMSRVVDLSLEDLQAINKQVEELIESGEWNRVGGKI